MPYGSRYRRRRFGRRFPRLSLTRRFLRRNPKNKYSPRRWRRRLLSDSFASTHYRSIFARGFAFGTAAVGPGATSNLHFDKVLALPSATPFWTTGGGAQPVDQGNAVPGFGRNIILRGGRISVTAALRTNAVETVKVTVFLIWRKPCSDDTIVPANGDRAFLWDPSVEPDFTRYGRILWKKHALLEPQTGSSSVQMFHNLRPQKIDHENFEKNGQHLEWVVCCQKITALNNLATTTVDFQFGHSLSFSGDEIS